MRLLCVARCPGYQNALKKDPNNLQILKDLSHLQIQRRSMEGFRETRRQILLLKTNNRNNWLAYAVGNQLSGDYDKAINVVDSFLKTQDDDAHAASGGGSGSSAGKSSQLPPATKPSQQPAPQNEQSDRASLQTDARQWLEAFEARSRVGLSFEDSELRLYRLTLLTESAQWSAALDYLDSIAASCVDSLFVLEQRAELLLRLGRTSEAEVVFRHLLTVNAEQLAYHRGLHGALGLRVEEPDALLRLYAELREQFPRSALVRRLPLEYAHGAAFDALLAPYMASFIRRAIPSLFADLRPLYADVRKARQIEAVLEGLLAQLRAHRRFGLSSYADDGAAAQESPSCLLWTLVYAAQHFDHLGQRSRPRRTTGRSHSDPQHAMTGVN